MWNGLPTIVVFFLFILFIITFSVAAVVIVGGGGSGGVVVLVVIFFYMFSINCIVSCCGLFFYQFDLLRWYFVFVSACIYMSELECVLCMVTGEISNIYSLSYYNVAISSMKLISITKLNSIKLLKIITGAAGVCTSVVKAIFISYNLYAILFFSFTKYKYIVCVCIAS